MSNYGNIGTRTVNNYNSLRQGIRADERYAAGEEVRDYANRQAELKNATMDADIDAAGGTMAQLAKQQSDLAMRERQYQQNIQHLNLVKKQAQINKVNAQTAKVAMGQAAKLTNKKTKVAVTSSGRGPAVNLTP